MQGIITSIESQKIHNLLAQELSTNKSNQVHTKLAQFLFHIMCEQVDLILPETAEQYLKLCI